MNKKECGKNKKPAKEQYYRNCPDEQSFIHRTVFLFKDISWKLDFLK